MMQWSNAAEWHYELANPNKLKAIVSEIAGPHLKEIPKDKGPRHEY
jgi:hypothetical protein